MEAILKFNLPEDKDEFTLATKGSALYSAIFDIYNYLRSIWKYDETLDEKQNELINKIYERFFELLNENDVSIDMVS